MNDRPKVTAQEALDRICGGALLLDLRDVDEYVETHVHGSAHIPLPDLEARVAEIPKDRDVLLLCRSDRRSGLAQATLEDVFGYRNVSNVTGGILAWEDAGLPVVKASATSAHFEQFYLGCLAHASYLFGSNGEGAVVDPQRDIDTYIEAAAKAGLQIRYVFETHVHADFVSGHRELAARTGADIVFGHRAAATFPHVATHDGDTFHVGSIKVRVLETPGHTPEGICLLLNDVLDPSAPARVLTGDTLFIGDVGRPDLVGSKGFTAADMAAMLYDSLHDKLLKLDDAVEVYPAHGAGSLCGRSMSTERSSTIGAQRVENAALQPMSKEAFVAMMTTALPEQPAYFALDAEMNRTGATSLADIPKPRPMTPGDVKAAMLSGAMLLDVRPSEVYGPRHVAYSMNIGLDGQFAAWAGALIPFTRRLIVLAEETAQVDEAVVRLARIGIANVDGYLEGGLAAWDAVGFQLASIPQISTARLNELIVAGEIEQLIDVRRQPEIETGVAPGAIPITLTSLESSIEKIDPEKPITLICGSGYRSSAAGSILESSGFTNITNVDGGMGQYTKQGFRVVDASAA